MATSAPRSANDGTLYTGDPAADRIVSITGALHRGTAYTAVTPANANVAPSDPTPNYLGVINLTTGARRYTIHKRRPYRLNNRDQPAWSQPTLLGPSATAAGRTDSAYYGRHVIALPRHSTR